MRKSVELKFSKQTDVNSVFKTSKCKNASAAFKQNIKL
jgi:hypothetical protein